MIIQKKPRVGLVGLVFQSTYQRSFQLRSKTYGQNCKECNHSHIVPQHNGTGINAQDEETLLANKGSVSMDCLLPHFHTPTRSKTKKIGQKCDLPYLV